MTGGRDHYGCSDGIGVHARLRVVVERDEGPVGDDTKDALAALEVRADDEIFDCSCVQQDDIGKGQDSGQDSGGEECGVFDHDKGAIVFIRDADFLQESVCWLTDDLGKVRDADGAVANLVGNPCSPSGSSIGRRAKRHPLEQRWLPGW